ncbi:MAG TPA: IPT/TIG domain-containing protein [Blastocatellia bacterium]|nr:IPT/TIG domain-containing protein [Blastocatellia bacterium]
MAGDVNATVTVFTPAPGGGTSQAATFVINAVFTGGSSTPTGPAITSISPELTPAGSSQFTLTVNGVRFSSNSVVKWNGTDLATSFVSASQLTATVPAGLVAAAGDAAVVVYTPSGNNQGTSQQATFRTVSAAGTITSLSPNTIAHGGPAFTLTVNGSGFSQNTKVIFDGAEKPTSFVSSTQLRAQISAADIATARTVGVKVKT